MTRKAFQAVAEQRSKERHQVETMLPAQFLDGASERSVPCRIYDVSDDGLCVLTSEPLTHGDGLVFVTLRQQFQFTVAWCRTEANGREHRAGLKLDGAAAELRTIFAVYLDAAGARRPLSES